MSTPYLPNASYCGHAECIIPPFEREEILSHIEAPFRADDKHDHLTTCLSEEISFTQVQSGRMLSLRELVICSKNGEEILDRGEVVLVDDASPRVLQCSEGSQQILP